MSSNTKEEVLAVELEGEEKTENQGADLGAKASEDANAEAESDATVTLSESPEKAPANPLAELQGEIARWKDLAMRGQAELDNYRKRMAREKADAIRFGNVALLESLLPVVDNFRFGLEAARREAGPSIVVDGMSMVYKQFNDLLEEFGVKEIPAEGLSFDPNLHEAVQEESSEKVEEGHVISVIRKGFRLHDRLLRPANVIVSRGRAEPAEQAQTSTETQPSLTD